MKQALFFNSALAFASAELMTSALHEVGHGIAAQCLGFSPHIYAFYKNNPSGDARKTLMILAAGPITSLVLDVVFLDLLSAVEAAGCVSPSTFAVAGPGRRYGVRQLLDR